MAELAVNRVETIERADSCHQDGGSSYQTGDFPIMMIPRSDDVSPASVIRPSLPGNWSNQIGVQGGKERAYRTSSL